MYAIHTEQLTKYYGKARGIIDLDLAVEEGEFFGFIGPNGAGKSTTIRTLLGLIGPTKGTAQVFGRDIVSEKTAILADAGYLPSEATFYGGMKVRDILKLSANLRKTDCRAESASLCDRLQLDTSRKVDELSFGNRKKVGIVCALQHMPRLLILDEPTSGLDPLMQREFFKILRERNHQGTTVFLSSHVLSEIQRNCQRAAIIRDGRLVACDSVDALAKTNARRVTVRGDFVAKERLGSGQAFDTAGLSTSGQAFDIAGLSTSGQAFDTAGLSGVRDLQISEDGVSFLYSGDINQLTARLAKCRIDDILVAEPDLEEIFLHYYADDNEGGEPR
ncbi:ABC transporter ATP-binding protein [Aminicella lysinilytica]|uniref:ABC transporter ATP-binding protein n=1 Tax=Aminicella lysinilytica TaxID=433323 RepID=UPI0026EFD006|nr:ABC transporter ATP-binding protein [Aminicella lysinilytica]